MNFLLADSHPPVAQYDMYFVPDKFQELDREGMVIYVHLHELPSAINWLQKQDYSASIILRNGDVGVEKNEFGYYFGTTNNLVYPIIFTERMIPENLNALYVQNVNVNHFKIRHYPLGILSKNSNILKRVLSRTKNSCDLKKRNIFCYVNFEEKTSPFRTLINNHYLKNSNWSIIENGLELEDYYKRIQDSIFVVCPRGNGHDSFRVWESLYLGAIPIVSRTVGFEQLSNFLPIVIVDSWSELNFEFLEDALHNIQAKPIWWTEMLDQNFWNTHVKNNRTLHLETY